MRIMMKVELETEAVNAAMKAGTFGRTIKSILNDIKPEAAYFAASKGARCGWIFVKMRDASEIPGLCEPFFHAFNAKIEIQPAMVAGDLSKAGGAIKRSVKRYG